MKKLTAIISAALCVCLAACSSAGGFPDGEILSNGVKRSKDTSATFNYSDGCREAPSSYNSFANTVTGFSLKLLRNSYDGKAVSLTPASAAVQLGLLANGAKGDSRSEILLALGGELDLDSYNTCSSYFKSRMENVGRIARLQANADFYGDDIIRYDFSSGADKLTDYLGDKITLSGDESVASYSELNLSDVWLNQSLEAEELSMQSGNARGIVKYTANNPLKALFIMPDGDFDSYVRNFDSVEYSKLLDSVDFTKRQAAVIPPFQTEAQTAELSSVLQKIGLYTLFDENGSFGNMTYSDDLTLSKFYCSTPSLGINAQGIAAGAATADSAQNQTSGDEAWVFDKPFIFMLVDNETNIPVYISTVA